MPNYYKDIQELWRQGWWPNKTTPEWVKKRRKELNNPPTLSPIIEYGLEQTIQQLQERIGLLKTDMELAIKDLQNLFIQDAINRLYNSIVQDLNIEIKE